jgi:hypothetical protein
VKLKTYPRHRLDVVLWPLLRLLWEPFSKKQSHWWHWRPYEGTVPENFREYMEGDGTARPRKGILGNLIQTNFGWKKVAILGHSNHYGHPILYQLGFTSTENGVRKKELCTVVLNDYCAALLGPSPTEFFAVSYPEGNPIPIDLVVVSRKDHLPRNVVLL